MQYQKQGAVSGCHDKGPDSLVYHQDVYFCSALSQYLFMMLLDDVLTEVRDQAPQYMLFGGGTAQLGDSNTRITCCRAMSALMPMSSRKLGQAEQNGARLWGPL